MRPDKRISQKAERKTGSRGHRRGVVGYSRKSALLEEAITYMNTGKYGRSSASLKELLALDPQNMEARRLFATLHLKLGSLVTARQAFESLANEAIGRQDYWLAESLLQEYLAAGPRCVPFLELLAHVYEAKGDEMAAVGELGKAIEILRDDPDPDHAQKAAHLYAKIRELAPVSRVALELAALFDVRTGELLIRHEAPTSQRSSDGIASLQDDSTTKVSEGFSPEVLPWELSDAPPAETNSPAQSSSTSQDRSESSVPPELSPPNDLDDSGRRPSDPEDTISSLESSEQENESSVGLPPSIEPVSEGQVVFTAYDQSGIDYRHAPEDARIPERLSDGSMLSDESLGKGGLSPMPWDQVADASVQILEPEPSPTSDPHSGLEAIPASAQPGEQGSALPSSDGPFPGSEADPIAVPDSSKPSSADVTGPIPSPMPWEQVADATVQIPETECSSLEADPLTSADPFLSAQTTDTGVQQISAESAEVLETDSMSGHPDRSFIESSEETITPEGPTEATTVDETVTKDPDTTSFSWSSILDTAWKIAVGSNSPSASSHQEEQPEVGSDAHKTGQHGESEQAGIESISFESHSFTVVDRVVAEEPSASSPVVGTVDFVHESMASDESSHGGGESLAKNEETVAQSSHASNVSFLDLTSSYQEHADSTIGGPLVILDQPTAEISEAFQGSLAESYPAVVEPQQVEENESTPAGSTDSSVVLESTRSELQSPPLAEDDYVESISQSDRRDSSETLPSDPVESEGSPKTEDTISLPGAPSHWSTGEVDVQIHRPAAKRKKWEKESEAIVHHPPQPTFRSEWGSETHPEAERDRDSDPTGTPTSPLAAGGSSVPDSRPDWMQASEAITLARSTAPSPSTSWGATQDSSTGVEGESTTLGTTSAIDVLFSPETTGDRARTYQSGSWSKPRPRLVARLHRVRIAVSSFIFSCFSTTRSITFLALMICAASTLTAAIGVGVLGLAWMGMEEPPSVQYRNLTISPPRAVSDANKNGYLLLLELSGLAGRHPVLGQSDANTEENLAAMQVCISGADSKDGLSSAGASSHVVKGWFRGGNPAAQAKGQADIVRSLAAQESTSLARYQEWLTMPFDDWGYGKPVNLDCPGILFAHRLFLMEGFAQETSTGLDRLEADLQSWRAVLAQSKSLAMKMLAVTAVQDDVTTASGLLSRAELDGTSLTRLSKLVRPLDQAELSLRWPMQSYFVWATQSVATNLKRESSHDRPWYVSLVAAMKLPVQQRANAYAEYYEAANKAVAEGRFTNLPKVSTFLRTPATGVMDYLANPVEHIVGIQPLPSWDPYVMRMIEADAQLRLAGLQVWLRRGPQEGNVLTRLAKAGQAYYDPFTGLPMLVNQRKGLIYSVGRDGKDQEGDRALDVSVDIPSAPSPPSDPKRLSNTTQPL